MGIGMAAKKVTLSVPDELLAVVDVFVVEHPGATRSGVVADALQEWARSRQEAEIEQYYLSLSGDERAEDESWRTIAAESAKRLWP
jgi:metal-responsive CopG/Arc/MetJ family transcriptional regulator